MNVHFPGYGTSEDFWVIFGIMAAALIGMLSFFRYKRWL
jgi:Mg2+ and Co2+ transporter CorA